MKKLFINTSAPFKILVLFCLLAGCSATVPLASTTQDMAAKAVNVAADKSAIYVIQSTGYTGELNFANVDKEERVALAAETYTVFTVNPGKHTVTLDGPVNRERLSLNTEAGNTYFVEMGYGWAGGFGHLKVTASVLNESEGRELLGRAKLVASQD